MIGRPEISRLAVAGGVSEGTQEKDYVLAWLLAARDSLGPSSLVFKGGTALRRCYFPGYRYSEDLDFSADDQPPLEMIWMISTVGAIGSVIAQESGPRLRVLTAEPVPAIGDPEKLSTASSLYVSVILAKIDAADRNEATQKVTRAR